MNCKLKIKDNYIKTFLGKEEYDSIESFKFDLIDSIRRQKMLPLSIDGVTTFIQPTIEDDQISFSIDYLKKVKAFDYLKEYGISKSDTFTFTENALFDFLLYRVLDTPSNFENVINQIENKLGSDNTQELQILDEISLVNSLIKYAKSVPGLESFKDRLAKLQETLNEIKSILDSSLSESVDEEERLTYMFINQPILFEGSSDEAVLNNPLDIVRLQLGDSITDKDEIYIRLEKDNPDNVQISDIPTDGVVGVLYNKTGQRLYIKKGKNVGKFGSKIELTPNINEAYTFTEGVIKPSANFTVWVPDMENPIYDTYIDVNIDAKMEMIAARQRALSGQNSPMYRINSFRKRQVTSYTKAITSRGTRPIYNTITLSKFLKERSPQAVNIISENFVDGADRFFKGNLSIQIDNKLLSPFRTALTPEEQQEVLDLINFSKGKSKEVIDEITAYLNILYKFHGGDLMFYSSQDGVVAYAFSTKTSGKIERLNKPKKISTKNLATNLTYAKINVDKKTLEGNLYKKIVKDDSLETVVVNGQQWYFDHHITARRQITTPNGVIYRDLKLIQFDIFDTKEVETSSYSGTPRDLKGFIERELDLSNSDEDTKRFWELIIGLGYDKLEGVTIKFDTTVTTGSYSNGVITINPNLNKAFQIQVLAHEVGHSLTVDWIKNNQDHEITKRLKEIAVQYEKVTGEKISPEELVVSLNKEDVVEKLKSIKSKNKNLLQQLVDLVKSIFKEILNTSGIKNSVYVEVANLFVRIGQMNAIKEQEVGDIQKVDEQKIDDDILDMFGEKPKVDDTWFWEGEKEKEKQKKSFIESKGKSTIKKVIESMDTDILNSFMVKDEDFNKFMSGKMGMDEVFNKLIASYFNRIEEYKRIYGDIKNFPPKILNYLNIVVAKNNRDIIKEIWKENSSFLFKKTKKETLDPNEVKLESSETEDIPEELLMQKEIEDNVAKNFDRDGNAYNLTEADKITRLIIRMIPKVERNNDGTVIYSDKERADKIKSGVREGMFHKIDDDRWIKVEENEFGTIALNDLMLTWNLVSKFFRDQMTINDMISYVKDNPIVKDKALSSVPELFILINWLEQRLQKTTLSDTDLEIITKIESSFKRFANDPVVLIESKNSIDLVNEGQDIFIQARNIINNHYVNSVINNLTKYYDKDTSKFNLLEYLKDKKIMSLQPSNVEEVDELLQELGFVIKTRSGQYATFREKVLFSLKAFYEKQKKPQESFIDVDDIVSFFVTKNDFFDELKGYFLAMMHVENEKHPFAVSQMVRNAENELQSVNSIPNGILQDAVFYSTKDHEDVLKLVPRAKNPIFKRSLAYRSLYDTSGKKTSNKLLVENYNGYKTTTEGESSKGSLTIDLDDSDWILMNTISLITKGTIENNRAETASTSYSYKFVNGWLGSRKTPLEIGDIDNLLLNPKDSLTDEILNITKESELWQIWSNYLKGEIESGTISNKRSLWNPILKENPALIDKLTSVESVDENFVEISTLFKNYIIKSYNDFDNLFENLVDKNTLYKNSTVKQFFSGNKVRAKLFLVLNTLTLHTEEIIMFHGDFSEHGKFFKRAKSIQSTRIASSQSPQVISKINEDLEQLSFGSIIGSPLRIGETFKSSTMKDLEIPSPNLKDMKEGFEQSIKITNPGISEEKIKDEIENLSAYEKTTISDGQGWGNPDFYFAMLKGLGADTNFTKAYKALVYDMIKNKEKYFTKEELKELNLPELTIAQEEEMKSGLELLSKGEVIFPSLKWTHRGGMIDDGVVAKEVLDKFSIFPLFIQYCYDKPVLKRAFLGMLKQGIGYTKFKSGTKISNTGTVDIFSQQGTFADFSTGEHTLLSHNLGEQIKTPIKVKSQNTFGSQFRKLIISGLRSANREDFNQFSRAWEKTIQAYSKDYEKRILSEFGIDFINGEWSYDSMDMQAVSELLVDQGKQRNLPDSIIDAFEKIGIGEVEHLESIIKQKEVQNVIASLIKDIAIQKVLGAQLIQVSSAGHDDFDGRKLKWYKFDPTGTKKAECKISMMGHFKYLRNLPEVSDKLKELNINGNDTLKVTSVINEFLKDDSFVEKYENELTIVLYRIPTQGFNSMDSMIVREFLPVYQSPQIVLPPEIVVKSGTDYDYDKESVILPTIDQNSGKLIEFQELDFKESSVELISMKNANRAKIEEIAGTPERLEEIKKWVRTRAQKGRELKEESETLKKAKAIFKEDEDILDKMSSEEYDRISNLGYLEEDLEESSKDIKERKRIFYENKNLWDKLAPYLKEERRLNKMLNQIKQQKLGLQNEMIKHASNILLHPGNFHRLIIPNSTKIIFDAIDKLYEKMELFIKEDPVGANIVTPYTNYLKWKSVKGKNLLGITAVANTYLSLIQQYDFHFNKSYNYLKSKKKGIYVENIPVRIPLVPKSYRDIIYDGKINAAYPYTSNGVSKIETISQLINVTVDMPSDDRFGYSNFNRENFGAALHLIMVHGVDFNTLLNFFHQPIIYKFNHLVKYYQKQINPYSQSKEPKTYNRKESTLKALSELFGIEIPVKGTDFLFEDFNDFQDTLYSTLNRRESKLEETLDEYGVNVLFGGVPKYKDALSAYDKASHPKKENQLNALAHYIKILHQGEINRQITRSINFDTSPDNVLIKVFGRNESKDFVRKSKMIDMSYIDRIYSDSVISGLNNSNILRGISEKLYKSLYSELSQYMFMELYKKALDKERFENKIPIDFMTSIIQNFGKYEGENIVNIAKPFLFGDKRYSLSKEAVKLNERFLNEFKSYTLLKNLVSESSKKRIVDRVTNVKLILGFASSTEDINNLTEEFRELLNHPDKEVSDFAKNLAIVAIVQAGYQQSPIFFSNVIPSEFLTSITEQAFKEYDNLPELEQSRYISKFIKTFTQIERTIFDFEKNDPETYRFKNYKIDLNDIKEPRNKDEKDIEIEYLPKKEESIQEIDLDNYEKVDTKSIPDVLSNTKGELLIDYESKTSGRKLRLIKDIVYDFEQGRFYAKQFNPDTKEWEDRNYITSDTGLKGVYLPKQQNNVTTVDKSMPWSVLKDLPVYSDKGVMVMRKQNTQDHFGNPFTGSGIKGLIQMPDISSAVMAYKSWLRGDKTTEDTSGKIYNIENVNPEQRQWILNQIEQGKLDGKKLLYMSDKGEYYSHADALSDIVNNKELSSTFKGSTSDEFLDYAESLSSSIEDSLIYRDNFGVSYRFKIKDGKVISGQYTQGNSGIWLDMNDKKAVKKYGEIQTNPNQFTVIDESKKSTETYNIPIPTTDKNIIVPEGSSPNNSIIFEDEKNIYLMNDDQQNAYNNIKTFVNTRLIANKTSSRDTQEFNTPLSKEYSGIIPKELWNNMYGLIGKGGVGKTSVIKKIMEDIEKENANNYKWIIYNFAAPTHNAVTVLQESLGQNSERVSKYVTTTASLVARNQTKGSDSAETGKPEDELLLLKDDIYLEYISRGYIQPISSSDVIIIDESSMVGISFIEDMLRRIHLEMENGYGKGSYPIMIFMGDYRQLPPINAAIKDNFAEGIISATLFSDKEKTSELTQIMRSSDKDLHKIFDAVGDQISQQRKDFNSNVPINPFNWSMYDEVSSKSTKNILVIDKSGIDYIIDTYTNELINNDNPYEIFWVHYNKLEHPKTQELFKKIRNKYFEKLGISNVSNNIQKGEYVQFMGSLPMETSANTEFKIQAGQLKPRARVKIVDIGTQEVNISEVNSFFKKYFKNVSVNSNYYIFYNRQDKKRLIYSFEENTFTSKYDKVTKKVTVSVKDANGVLHDAKISYGEYKENKALLDSLSKSIESIFQPSYIGSSHTVQGASIKKVIVGEYNIRENAPNIALRDMESSLYTSLTRASKKLIIIKPIGSKIENNQKDFVLNDIQESTDDQVEQCIPI